MPSASGARTVVGMAEAVPIVSLFDALREDPSERAAFAGDPDGYLSDRGWSDLGPGELREALGFVRETVPLDLAVRLPDPDATDDADTSAVLGSYVEAVIAEPVPDAGDLEDFGADAAPLEAEAASDEPAGHEEDEDDGFDAPIDGDDASVEVGEPDAESALFPEDEHDDAEDDSDDEFDL